MCAEQDEVVLVSLQRHAQGPGGGQRIGPCKGAVGDVEDVVCTPGKPLEQPLLGLRWAHGEDPDLNVVPFRFQLGRALDSQLVVAVQLMGDSLPDDPPGFRVKPDARERRDPFHTDSNLHSTPQAVRLEGWNTAVTPLRRRN